MKIALRVGVVLPLSLVCLILVMTMFAPPRKLLTQPSSSDRTTQIVATVGSHTITLADVERTAALPLHQLDTQRATLLNTSLQHLIEEKLLAVEAARLNVPVSDMLEHASESETVARLANLPAPVRRAKQDVHNQTSMASEQSLEDISRIRQALLVQLRRNTEMHVTLFKPELPVLNVNADGNPWIGTADAPITIIEFSDFECPYCKQSLPLLKKLLTAYPGKVKIVYRDFPGPNHSQAVLAAEAAQCAEAQGQFWKYHDALFTTYQAGTRWNFSALAQELGLQPSIFDGCMDGHRYREEVMRDLQDGLKLGVMSTPTFFINGRPLVGARPLVDFQTIIDSLLHQSPS